MAYGKFEQFTLECGYFAEELEHKLITFQGNLPEINISDIKFAISFFCVQYYSTRTTILSLINWAASETRNIYDKCFLISVGALKLNMRIRVHIVVIEYYTYRQWCFRRPNQNSVWQFVHLETAWSGTHKTPDKLFALALDDGPLRSSTASHEPTDIFSTPLSTTECWIIPKENKQINKCILWRVYLNVC